MTTVKKTKKGLTAQEGGHFFQGEVQKALTELQKTCRMRSLRLYDTRSTAGGNVIPEQDGDFLAMCAGKGWLIEVKASLKFESLGESRSSLTEMVAEHQAAAQRIWVRSGGYGLVIFHHLDSSVVELWRGDVVGLQRATPREHLDYQFVKRVGSSKKELLAALKEVLFDPSKLFYGENHAVK